MTQQRKNGARPFATSINSSAFQKVLEACNQLPLLSGDQAALRTYIAETARVTLQASVAGMLLREDETYVLGSVAGEDNRDLAKSSLISHAKVFATKALQTKKLLNFSLTSTGDVESSYFGMAEPLITSQSATVLVVLREEAF